MEIQIHGLLESHLKREAERQGRPLTLVTRDAVEFYLEACTLVRTTGTLPTMTVPGIRV